MMLVSFCKSIGMEPYTSNGYACASVVLLRKVYLAQDVISAIELHQETCRLRGYKATWNDVCDQSRRYYLEQVVKMKHANEHK